MTGLFVVLSWPLVLFAQYTNTVRPVSMNTVESTHAGLLIENSTPVERLIRSADVGQMTTEAQLKKLQENNERYSNQLAQIIEQHQMLVTLLKGAKDVVYDQDFYKSMWEQLGDLAQAVKEVPEANLARESGYLLDHTYFFAPYPNRLYALREVLEITRRELENAGEDTRAGWTDFYSDFTGYSN